MTATMHAWIGTAFAALFLGGCYTTRQFNGDGAITHIDSAWCDYAIEFPPIDAMSEGEYVFEFAGCPRRTLHVGLFLTDRLRQEQLLEAAGASVAARMVEIASSGNEQVMFELDGPLVIDRTAFQNWIGASPFMLPPSFEYSEAVRRAGWSYGVGWYRFNPRSSYRLRFVVSVDSQESAEPVWLTPLIWGGGLMQPIGLAQN